MDIFVSQAGTATSKCIYFRSPPYFANEVGKEKRKRNADSVRPIRLFAVVDEVTASSKHAVLTGMADGVMPVMAVGIFDQSPKAHAILRPTRPRCLGGGWRIFELRRRRRKIVMIRPLNVVSDSPATLLGRSKPRITY